MVWRIAIIAIVLAATAFAGDSLRAPDTLSLKEPPPSAERIAIKALLAVYQEFVTDLDAHECPMTPSCSNFSKRAFQKTGPFRAFLLTFDRLMRDNSFAKKYYLKNENDKLVDPVERYIR
jgi:putative component of membrane protein insertase Oxa1/YidC/SpoIIIJ protein YidD